MSEPEPGADEGALLVATVDGEDLRVDGEEVGDHPYRRSLRSRTAYYPAGTDTAKIEAYMDVQDVAYVGSRRGYPTYTFRNEGGAHSFRVAPASSWGITEREPREVEQILYRLRDACAAEEWELARAVSTLAGRICREHATEMRQLPSRWRTLAHNAIHQGPSVVCTGGSQGQPAHQWDRQEAFLRALFLPMPLRDTWTALAPGAPWKRYSRHQGIVRATVRIDGSEVWDDVPPMPIRDIGATVYPTGTMRGVWTLELLADAVNSGHVEVLEVHEAMRCETAPIHAWAGERIAQVKDRALKKLLYTRYWGRLAAMGGWQGTVMRPEAERGVVHRFTGSNLYWVWTGYNVDSHDCSPDYRPDHAAFIASANHLRMNQELRRFRPGSVIATHVDAIWTSDTAWKPAGDDFRLKRTEPVRFYGIGTYAQGDRLAAQGYEGPALTPQRLEEWGASLRQHPFMRAWRDLDQPQDCPWAQSSPPVMAEREISSLPEISIYSKRWTQGGWIRRVKPEEEPDARPDDDDRDAADGELATG